LLLLAHLDVVEARREDWSFDPFKLVEEGGYLYGRGTSDDKFMAAAFVTNLIRYSKKTTSLTATSFSLSKPTRKSLIDMFWVYSGCSRTIET
jgi:acetylornithine deacetylase/succinyl-diaminopimelate desuccinylase-like protein